VSVSSRRPTSATMLDNSSFGTRSQTPKMPKGYPRSGRPATPRRNPIDRA
jgi:hypothetical protein